MDDLERRGRADHKYRSISTIVKCDYVNPDLVFTDLPVFLFFNLSSYSKLESMLLENQSWKELRKFDSNLYLTNFICSVRFLYLQVRQSYETIPWINKTVLYLTNVHLYFYYFFVTKLSYFTHISVKLSFLCGKPRYIILPPPLAIEQWSKWRTNGKIK